MTEYTKHIYMTLFPNNALIASHLEPEQFAKHLTVGTAKHYQSKLVFAEVNINFRDPFFEIDEILAQTVPHPVTGKPKRTKFIASYATLEHVALSAIGRLYLVTAGGQVLGIEAQPYTRVSETGRVRVYQEINPLHSLVAANSDPREFGKWITRGTRSKSAPKVCFTQIDMDVDRFAKEHTSRMQFTAPIPEIHPLRLYDCLKELLDNPNKKTKTISLGSVFRHTSYKRIKHGFWIADGDDMLYFPIPPRDELEKNHYDWWREVM
ncbi:MAG TPA: hypothetical protein PLT67_07795 [Kiritimatiellia bacterium]|nr:hypothetical protein [Kiritimatiellia bacterium]